MVGNHVIENLCHPSRTLQQQGTAKVCILQFSNSFFAAQAWCVEERRGVKPAQAWCKYTLTALNSKVCILQFSGVCVNREA